MNVTRTFTQDSFCSLEMRKSARPATWSLLGPLERLITAERLSHSTERIRTLAARNATRKPARLMVERSAGIVTHPSPALHVTPMARHLLTKLLALVQYRTGFELRQVTELAA